MSLYSIVKAKGGTLYANGARALIPAPGHSASDRSVSLVIGQKGRVIVHCFGGATVKEVLADLSSAQLIDEKGFPCGPGRTVSPAPPNLSQRERQARAAHIWQDGVDLPGTLSSTYLTRFRAIRRPVEGMTSLRHHSACPISAYRSASFPIQPALIARLQTPSGTICGVEITYLTPDGKRDMRLHPSRKIIGIVPAGSFVALDEPVAEMVVGEGVMTVLSASDRFQLPALACLSAGNLAGFQPTSGLRKLIIAADKGQVGEQSAARLCARLRSIGLSVDVRLPPEPYDDFNSWAQAEAKKKGRAERGDV